MQRNITFTGDFTVFPREALRPGGFYIGFLCRHCRQHFAIMDDPTNSGDIAFSGNAVFHAVCPNCDQANDYAATELVAFESAQGGPTSTA